MTNLRAGTAWVATRWNALSSRERTLVAGAAALATGLGALLALHAALDDLTTLRTRVAGRERELAQVRRLALRLRQAGGPSAPVTDEPSLVTRLEAAATAAVGRERIASMTPAQAGVGNERQEHMALRVAGASLGEIVRLLHTLESGPSPLAVSRLELRKHPDDPSRFDATVEVARALPGSPR